MLLLRRCYVSRNFAVMRNPPDLLTVAQAAAELGIAPRTVLHRISLGKLAAERHGTGKTSAFIITRAEVERVKAEAAA